MPKPAYRDEIPTHVRVRMEGRTARLRGLGYKSYPHYLASRHWIELRRRYRESDLPQECICGEEHVQLHHLTYERIGAEDLADLTPLCKRCHAMAHALEWRREIGLDLSGFCDDDRAIRGRALIAELVAQSEGDIAAHRQKEQAHVLSLSFSARLVRATEHARARKVDVRPHLKMIRRLHAQGGIDMLLTKRLRVVEQLAYGWDGWRDQLS